MGARNFIKTYILLILFTAVSAFSYNAFPQKWMREMYGHDELKNQKSLYDIQDKAKTHFKYAEREYYSRYFNIDDNPELQYKNVRDYISFKRWEEYWLNHVDDSGFPVPPIAEYNEYSKYLQNNSKGPDANWVNINRTAAPGGYWGMGRIREIAFHPSDPNTMWLGADQGGIWKTTDNGDTYTPIGDGLPFLRVSSICVDQTNPDVLYMAGGGIGTNYWQRAIGVYKSIDGGDSWIATGFTSELADNKYVRRLVMSPTDPAVLLVSTRTATYRTDDEGATWTNVLGGEAWDILFHPDGSTVFIGRGSDIYRSLDSGLSWEMILNSKEAGTFKHFTISPVNSNNLAAQVEGSSFTSIYFSTDKGETWEKKSTITDDTGGTIGFSSSDPETLYRGWTKIFKSIDAGATWLQKTMWYSTSQYDEVHADFFRIEKNPHKEDTLYFTNDGGMYIYDEANDEWTEKSAGLIISQYYSLSSSQSNPNVLLSGSQDNGGWYRKSDGTWRTTNGGDGMHTWQDPQRITYGYSSYPGGKIYKTNNAWNYYVSLYDNLYPVPNGGDWNSRFAIDPNNTSRIVTGCFKDVYQSYNEGITWTKISSNLTGGDNLHAIAIPESNSNIIYTSSGPYFYYTTDRGNKWGTSYVPSGNTIQCIEVSDYNPELVWVVTSGYKDGSKVFRSHNGGKSWENLTGSLPNIPALSIVHQKGTVGSLYVGMTYGIYYRNSNMNDWEFYGHGIPNTEIRDLDIQYSSGKIRCATYGRGLFEADLYPTSGIPPVADYAVEDNKICLGETISFINNSVDADSYIWNFGDGNSSTLENPEHLFSEPGTYKVRLTAVNENLTSTFEGEADLEVVKLQNTFKVGPKNREEVGYGRYISSPGTGLIFNVLFPSRLETVKVYAANSGIKTFEVHDAVGNLINTITANLRQGENIVSINTELPVGTEFKISVTSSDNLFYNLEGADYPYGKSKLVSIVGNSLYENDSYYFFYDWEVQALSCDYYELPKPDEADNIAIDYIILYPNPVISSFRINIKGYDENEDLDLRIISSDGTVVYNTRVYQLREINIGGTELGSAYGKFIIEVRGKDLVSSKQFIRLKK